MTAEEKAEMCGGKNFWHIFGNERLGLPVTVTSDGPHGLRRQKVDKSDNLGTNPSVPATCFPTSAASACSFDRELIYELGQALGDECRHNGVNVLLGPGVNHKRSPLCGRNFEYFSEDPRLSGELAAQWIKGVQSRGVGACLKHYALNSEENARFIVSSNADECAVHEIYLAAFRTAIREGKPWSVMPSYNLIDGVYSCQNPWLLKDIGRVGFGFDGAYISDWGAVCSVIDSFKSGLNVEMPGTCDGTKKKILAALTSGEMSKPELDEAVTGTIELALKAQAGLEIPYSFDQEKNLALAEKIATESAVLLKNDGALPLTKSNSLAVIGVYAKSPRYQGGGSSRINPVSLDNAFDALVSRGITFDYADGYDAASGLTDGRLLDEAVRAAEGKDAALIFAGLTENAESEGYDRNTLDLPDGHNKLIAAVAKVNPNVTVVLACGSAVTMPWIDGVKGVLLTYYAGCRCGNAAASLLTGESNPGGRLAETFPLSLSDTPCYGFYGKDSRNADYAESIFTGYRYYDTAGKVVLFPFGHGLSYTRFEYAGLTLSGADYAAGGSLALSVTVKNAGDRDGKEAVQLYVSRAPSEVFRPAKELKDFAKVSLKAGESKTVRFTLNDEAFNFYNTEIHGWDIEGGAYEISVGGSSADLPLRAVVNVAGSGKPLPDYRAVCPSYYGVKDNNFSQAEFYALRGRAGTDAPKDKPFNNNTTAGRLKRSFFGRIAYGALLGQYVKATGATKVRARAELENLPLRFLSMGAKKNVVDAVVYLANGRVIKAIKTLKK
jgi:beta-glucosidase